MKIIKNKAVQLSLLFSILLTIAGSCSVNPYTSLIVVTNKTNQESGEIKIGSLYLGKVYPGGTLQYYFFIEDRNASIDVGYFQPPPGYNGRVDLTPGYIYKMELRKVQGEYEYTITIDDVRNEERFH